jgi:phosphoglycerate kinase
MNLSSALPSFQTADLKGRAVLMRVDFNIAPTQVTPNNPHGLADDYRLRAHLPGIKEVLAKGARLALLSHRGRPQGQVAPVLSTLPLAKALTGLLGQTVQHVPDCIGRVAEQAIKRLEPGQVLMLENTRFHIGETLNDHTFVRQLANLGEVFINDAFATAHRAHGSVTGLTARLPSYLGPLMLKELDWLRTLTINPKRPLVAVVGGADVAGKLELVRHLLTKVDVLMLAGGIAHTFLASRDYGLGQSVLDPASVAPARDVFTEAGVVGCRLLLPQDVQALPQRQPGTNAQPHRTCAITELQGHESAMDIGPTTIKTWQKVMADAGSIVWLGALGAVEHPPFHEGTLAIARAVQSSPAFSVVAGDALTRILTAHNLREGIPHLSSGPAALHNALCGTPLPALQVLKAA